MSSKRLHGLLISWITTFSLLPGTCSARSQDLVSRIDPLIGTAAGKIGYGGTMPLVTAPFGMTNWTPQTRQNSVGSVSYEYSDKSISGFIGTHQPAIAMGDFGFATIMPEIGTLKTTPEERLLPFRHDQEHAHPDLYTVDLLLPDGHSIHVEMTASERCAMFRFTFPQGMSPRVLLETSRPGFDGTAAVDLARNELTGTNPERMDSNLGPAGLPSFRGYFVVQFQHKMASAATYGLGTKDAHGAYAVFLPEQGAAVLEARVGTSFLSIEQARENLHREMHDWNLERIHKHLHDRWKDKLNAIQVGGASPGERRQVYTSLYHALLYPRIFSEYGRYYSAFDDRVHKGDSYTDFSAWDTFRAENSLLTLVAPERIDGMITALLQDYREGGWMPKWPNPGYTNIMIGTPADSLVAEAIRKGFHGFDRKIAWQAVLKDATIAPDGDTTRMWHDREPKTPYEARAGLTYAKQLGYIPTDKVFEAASSTLEESYDDWCVAQVAKALGIDKEYRFFLERSLNYRLLYNKRGGLMQGKDSQGNWTPLENTGNLVEDQFRAGWTEGDAWVYTWAPLHDQAGLIELMGGEHNYNAKLDEHFSGGHNNHSNEPSHHYGYLYDFSGEPWKTQATVREIAHREYASEPAGLDGDDDCGQMSAWYLFTSLGMYPVNPASGEYMIGSPAFSRMSIRVGQKLRFTVVADGNSVTNVYVQSATLNGKPLQAPIIEWEQIKAGGTLRFVMGPNPSTWGSQWRHPSVLDAVRAGSPVKEEVR